ncbi:unnamed protein product [Peniophora sp. CBMAI 1063]|nr:unnamed protein product [Peniophora sp. CBMAI 1063]
MPEPELHVTRPETGKTGNPMGRPTDLGVVQCVHVDSGQGGYDMIRRDPRKGQRAITKYVNREVVRFFARFGWENPERSVPPDIAQPDEATVDKHDEEAVAASKAVKKGSASAKQQDIDKLVKKLILTRFQSRHIDPSKPSAVKSKSGDVASILHAYMKQPSLRQLYKVWATSKPRPELEAEIERRLPEVRKQKDNPEYGRLGLWNTVASELYNAASDEEKKEATDEAQRILDEQTEEWKKGLAEPQSVEEAAQFLVASQAFLEDLMHFFAERCGGMAVMILSGGGKVSVSQGTCDVPGKPKMLYSDLPVEKVLLEGIAKRIHTQACLVTEARWGVRVSDNTPGIMQASRDAGECPNATEPFAGPPPMLDTLLETVDSSGNVASTLFPDLDPAPPPAPHILSMSIPTPGNSGLQIAHCEDPSVQQPEVECLVQESVVQVVDVERVVSATTPYQAVPDEHNQQDTGTYINMDGMMTDGLPRAHSPSVRSRPRPRPKPTGRKQTTAVPEVTVSAAHTSFEQVNVVTERSEASSLGGFRSTVPSSNAATSDSNTFAESAEEEKDKRSLPDSSVGTSQSLWAFVPSPLDTWAWDRKEFGERCSRDGRILEERKPWFASYGMTAFLGSVPTKLEGRVDVGLGCMVVHAYMRLELSKTADGVLDLDRYKVNGEALPAYTVSQSLRKDPARMTWHKRTLPGIKRSAARMDLDVGHSLTRQWAYQQADCRRDKEGVLIRAADSSMDWEGRLPAGAHGARLLVLTLLCWGAEIERDADSEKTEWNKLARDFADVLSVLAVQAGPYKAPAVKSSDNTGKRIK